MMHDRLIIQATAWILRCVIAWRMLSPSETIAPVIGQFKFTITRVNQIQYISLIELIKISILSSEKGVID
jgi:hypothetical protein